MKKKLIIISIIAFSVITSTASAQTSEVSGTDKKNTSSYTFKPLHPNTINPRTFLYEMKPNSEAEDEIMVINQSDIDMHLEVYAADEGPLSDKGLPTVSNKSVDQKNIGLWMTPEISWVDLKPGEQKAVKWKIKVPEDAEKKLYIGGIAVVNYDLPGNKDNNIKASTRVILPVNLTVTDTPKEIPHYGQTNIFQQNPYLLPTLGIFTVCMGYFTWGTLKERKNKKKSLETNAE